MVTNSSETYADEENSYCKGKDCKKHTLHKVTQCEYPDYKR